MDDRANEIWSDVMMSSADLLPSGTTGKWLDTCLPVSLEGGLLTISVPNTFAKGKIENDIAGPLTEFLRSKGYAEGIEVVLEDGVDDPQAQPAPPIHTTSEGYKNGLNPTYVFETFVVGKSNRLAHAASLAVSENPGIAYNPLFIWGGVGLGKTHLMHAIGHHLLNTDHDAKIMYVSSEKFTNDMIGSIRSSSTAEFRARYRSLDVLLIDDIQFIGGKVETQEAFFNTFNSLHEAGKQIVISSDRPPKEIQGVEQRLVSRFQWGLVTDIQQPDLETRVAILQNKAELKGYEVPDDVILFIAQNIPSNIRELEGALNRVVANASVSDEPMNDDNLALWLKDVIIPKGSAALLSIDQIQQLVAESFRITVDELTSTSRTSDVALARQIAMYLARDALHCSLLQIQKAFKKKDHTTVIYACNRVTDLLKTDPRVRAVVENIRNKM